MIEAELVMISSEAKVTKYSGLVSDALAPKLVMPIVPVMMTLLELVEPRSVVLLDAIEDEAVFITGAPVVSWSQIVFPSESLTICRY